MNKFLVCLLIFLFVTASVLVCVYKPKTHKPIVFENRNFEISMMTDKAEVDKQDININIQAPDIDIKAPEISINVETPKINIETPKINVETPKIKVETPKINTNTNSSNKPSANKNTNNQKTTQNPIKTEKPKTVQQPKETPSKTQEIKQEVRTPEPVKKEDTVKETPKPVTTPPTPVVTPQKPAETPKQLTPQEEIIAWNKWRSDLQNKLMRDSKISAPIGTSFMFSFTVDKFGNVTNLKTWSSNPSYTPLAVRVIKPLLLSYQHTAILKFPEGSQRIITNAEGGFTMASSSRYSSPSDYNDYERVTR